MTKKNLVAALLLLTVLNASGPINASLAKDDENKTIWKQFLPSWGNWIKGSHPEDFDIGIDAALRYENKPCAYLKANVPNPDGFASIDQAFSAKDFRGKRVRYSGFVKTKDVNDWSGLWMKVDGADGVMAFDNMKDRAIKGTTDWKRYSVVLDVRDDSNKITIGYMLTGGGQVWLNDLKVEAVGNDVAVTGKPVSGSTKTAHLPPSPVNLDFSEKFKPGENK